MQIIAEIGQNHNGDFEIAKKMVRIAADFCMVNYVKFAKRTVKECLTEEQYNAPHPNPVNAFGDTYGEHRGFLEFTVDQHSELKELAHSLGLGYGCTVTDCTAARQIAEIKPDYIKVGSWHNLNFEIYDTLLECWSGDIHISTGATTKAEVDRIVRYFDKRKDNLVLYVCTSSYPTEVKDLCLLEIERYRQYGVRIGFSGHHTGIAPDMAAATLGAKYIERHFTLNRAWKGTDHAASVEPDGMRKIAKYVRDIHISLTYKEKEILDCEQRVRGTKV